MESRQNNVSSQTFYVEEIAEIKQDYDKHEQMLNVLTSRIQIHKAEKDPFVCCVSLALMAKNQGDKYTEAIKWYQQALQIKPDNVVKALLGVAYHQIGDEQKAQEMYEQALTWPQADGRPDTEKNRKLRKAEIKLVKTLIYFHGGNYSGKPVYINKFKKAVQQIKKDPNFNAIYALEAMLLLGLMYEQEMKYEAAIAIFDEIINLGRLKNKEGTKTLALYFPHAATLAKAASLIKLKKYDDALMILDHLTYSEIRSIHWLKAEIFAKKNNYQEAMKHYFLADYYTYFPLLRRMDLAAMIEGKEDATKEKKKLEIDIVMTRLRQFADFWPVDVSVHAKPVYKENYLSELFNPYVQTSKDKINIKINFEENFPEPVRSEVLYHFYKTYRHLNSPNHIQRLRKIVSTSPKYSAAQYILYGLFFKKDIAEYSHLDNRQTDIRQSFEHLLNAAAAGHYAAQNKAKEYQLNYAKIGAGKDILQIEAAAKKQWAAELNALPFTSVHYVHAHYALYHYYLELALRSDDVLKEPEKIFQDKIGYIKAALEHVMKAKLAHAVSAKSKHITHSLDEISAINEKIKKLILCGFPIELQEIFDNEVINQLQRINNDSPYYQDAQRILFEIYYYSRRNYIAYDSKEERLKDIERALIHMIPAYNLPPEIFPKLNRQSFLDNELQGNFDKRLGKPIYSKEGFISYRNKETIKESPCIPPIPGAKNNYYLIELTQQQLNNTGKARYTVNSQEIAYLEFSDEQIVLKSNGRHLHLRIQEGAAIHAPIIKIQNPNGKVILRGNIASQQGVSIEADAAVLRYSGTIHAKTDVKIETNGQLMINRYGKERSKGIYTENAICIQAASLIYCGILKSKSLIQITAACAQVKHGAIHHTTDFILSADDVTRLAGTFTCMRTLTFDIKRHIYITSRTLLSSQTNTMISAASGMIAHEAVFIAKNGNVFFNITKLTIKGSDAQTRLGSDGKTLMVNNLVIHADEIDNYAAWEAKNNIFIELSRVAGILRNHSSGFIDAGKRLFIRRGSVLGGLRNSGKIHYGESAWLYLNGLGIHGFTSVEEMFQSKKPENLQEFLDNPWESLGVPIIWGGKYGEKPINIVALAWISFLSVTKARIDQLIAAAGIHILDLIIANFSNRIYPIRFNLGIDAPNFELIIDSLKNFIARTLDHLKNNEFAEIAEDIAAIIKEDVLTARNAMTTLTVVRSLVSLLAPKVVSTSVNLACSIGFLAMNLGQFISYCEKLSELEEIEPWHIYYLLSFAAPLTNFGLQVYGQSEFLSQFDFNSPDLWKGADLSPQDIAMSALGAASLLGPKEMNTSLVSMDAGLHASGIKVDQTLAGIDLGATVAALHSNMSLHSYQTGVDASLQIDDMNMYSKHEGVKTGLQVSEQGTEAKQDGTVVAEKLNVNVQNLEQTGTVIAEQAQFSGQHLTFAGEVTVKKDCHMTASDTLIERGLVHANKAELAAPHVQVEGKVVTNEATTVITEKFDSSPQASLESKGSTCIQANTGDLSSRINTKQLVVEASGNPDIDGNKLANDGYKNITVQESLAMSVGNNVTLSKINPDINLAMTAPQIQLANDITTQHNFSVEATQGDLFVPVNVNAENVVLEASQGNVNVATHKTVAATDTIIVDAQKDVDQDGQLHAGNNILVHSRSGDIHNTNEMTAANHLQVIAEKGSVFNMCTTKMVPWQFDQIKIWKHAKMIGGDVYVFAAALVENKVSDIYALYKIHLIGGKGVSFLSEAYSYVSYHHHSRTLFGEKETTERSLLVGNSNVISEHEIEIESFDGPVYSVSANFQAEKNVVVHANDVTFTGIVAKVEKVDSCDDLFGLIHHKSESKDDVAVPTSVVNGGKLTIEAVKDDVRILNANIRSKQIEFSAKRNVIVSTPYLNHTIDLSSRTLKFSSFLDQLVRYANGDFSQWYAPFVGDLKAFSSTENGFFLGLNAMNTAIDGVKTVNGIITPLRQGNPLALLGDPTKVNVGITKNEMKSNYQTVAPNTIETETLAINAEGTTRFENGIPIQAHQVTINTDEFNQDGAKLSGYEKSNSQQFSLGFSAHGAYVGFTQVKTSTETETFVPQVLQTDKFTLHATTWQQHNAKVEVKADKSNVIAAHFSSVQEKNHSETQQTILQLSTTGDVGYSDKRVKTIGSDIQSRVSNAKVSLFFKHDLQQLQENLAWIDQQQKHQPAVAKEEVVLSNNKEAKHPVPPHNVYPIQSSKMGKQYDLSTKTDESWTEQKRWEDLYVIKMNDDSFEINENHVNDTFLKSTENWMKIANTYCSGERVMGKIEKVLYVDHFSEIYDHDIKQGKGQLEAIEHASLDVIKEVLVQQSMIYIFGSGPAYTFLAGKKALFFLSENEKRFDSQIEMIRNDLPKRDDPELQNSLLAKMSVFHVRDQLDQAEQVENIVAKIGKALG